MNEKLVIIICEIILSGAIILALATILVTSWYDLRAATTKRQLQRTAAKLNKARQPFITIVIYIQGLSAPLNDCLDSIRQSRYTNYRIVVADHSPKSSLRQIVKKYQQRYKNTAITFYSARSATSRAETIKKALGKAPAGDLVLSLDDAVRLTPNTLRDAASYFALNDHLTSLELRPHVESSSSISSLVPQFAQLTKNIIHKALSIVHLLPQSSYSPVLLKSSSIQSRHTSTYASMVTYEQASPIHPKKSAATLFLLIVAWLVIAAVMTYAIWTAASLRSNLLLTFSWISVCVWLLAVIWSDEATRLTKKVELTLSVPFMYFIFYAHAVTNFFVSLWQLIQTIPVQALAGAFKAELYSTNY